VEQSMSAWGQKQTSQRKMPGPLSPRKQTYAVQDAWFEMKEAAHRGCIANLNVSKVKSIGGGGHSRVAALLDLFPNNNASAFTTIDWTFVERRFYG
jgi:hypothetical protein